LCYYRSRLIKKLLCNNPIIVEGQTEQTFVRDVNDKAELLETSTYQNLVKTFSKCHSENRFIPYIETHEFEALLFRDVNILAEKSKIEVLHLKKIIEAYKNSEEINDDPVKSPAKQLKTLNHTYQKVVMGKVIGIPAYEKNAPTLIIG
jgi:hypothetical protein